MKFASRMEHLQGSDIRAILKMTEEPGMISFAGGMPAPELFPIEEIKQTSLQVLEQHGKQALQYTTTEGFVPLRQKIADRMLSKFKKACSVPDILITSGAQQGIDLAGRLFLDEGDVVLCESPSFLGAFQALRVYNPQFIEIATDEQGMVIEDLTRVLSTTDRVKLIYVIPDFQNPTGRSWSLSRRRELMEIANQYEVVVLEDNPYGELKYDGEALPSVSSFDKKGLSIFLGSFSKIFCPGLRLGWVCASPQIMEKFVLAKQAADTHSSTFSQRLVDSYMDSYDLEANIEKIKKEYKKRRDFMLEMLEQTFPQEAVFVKPEGGLFIWVELPKHMNTRQILVKSVEQKVAFVPGGSFYPNGGHENAMRLNFSNMPEEKIREGIPKLAAVLKQFLNE